MRRFKGNWLTGLEMIKMLALGQASAAALAKSRTIEALVLKRSVELIISACSWMFRTGTRRRQPSRSCSCRSTKNRYQKKQREQKTIHTITGHARLTGHTSRDENNLSISQCLLETVSAGIEARDLGVGVDVGEISSDACKKKKKKKQKPR